MKSLPIICKCNAGCDCDENSANPDDLCPADSKCKQCKCIPKGSELFSILNNFSWTDYDPGCDCDETLPNADSFCPRNETCKQCKCLAPGRQSNQEYAANMWHNFQAVIVMKASQMQTASAVQMKSVKTASV